MLTVHPAPFRFAQGPLHFQKDHFFDGFAMSLTVARSGNRRRHFDRQEIPGGELVTFPSPRTATVKRTPRDDAVPEDALGTAAARPRRRETTASHLAAAERDAVPPASMARIVVGLALAVNWRKVAAPAGPFGSLTSSGRSASLHGEQVF